MTKRSYPLPREDSAKRQLAQLRCVEQLEDLGVSRETAWLFARGEADPPAELVKAYRARLGDAAKSPA